MPWTNSDSRTFQSDDYTVETTTTSQSYSISADDFIANFSATVDDGTFKLSHDSGNSLIPTESDFDSGDEIKDMPVVNIQAWFIEQAADRLTRDELADAYEGVAGLAERVLADAASEMDELLDGGVPPIAAFNDVASDWPSEARVLLASYEQQNRDRSAYSNYEQELEQISVDDMMTGDEWQTTLTGEFGPNPFNDDSLTDEEAITVLFMREHDEEVSENLLGEIENHENFRAVLEDVGDAEIAAQHHRFDQSVPNDALRQSANADEWPDDLSPDSIRSENCEYCTDEFYEIYTENYGTTWCSRRGELHTEAIDIRNNNNYEVLNTPPGQEGILCGACHSQWESSAVRLTFLGGDEYSDYCIDRHADVVRDHSDEDNEFAHIDGITPPEYDFLQDALPPVNTRGNNNLQIRPNSEIGNVMPQLEALRDIAESPDEIDSGPVIIVDFGPDDVNAIVYDSDPEAAIEVKEHLEAAV